MQTLANCCVMLPGYLFLGYDIFVSREYFYVSPKHANVCFETWFYDEVKVLVWFLKGRLTNGLLNVSSVMIIHVYTCHAS